MSSEVDPLEWEASPGSRPAALITRCPMKHSAEGARMYIYIYIYIYLHLHLRPLGGVNGLQHALCFRKVLDINPPFLSHELPRQRSRCNWLTCDTPHHSSKEGTRTLCCRTVIYMHIDIHVHSRITRTQREGVFPLLFLAPTLSLSLFFPSGPDRKSAYRSSSDLSVSSLGGKLSHLGCTTSANKDQE